MSEKIQILISLYAIWGGIGSYAYLLYADSQECAMNYYGPVTKWLYKKTNMNIVGCALFALFCYILFPLLFIPRSIGMVVFWLFHIGRKG